MALVNVTDLREYMSGVSLNAAQVRTAQVVLDGTQQALELHLNRPVQPVQVRETRRSNGSCDLHLSVTPVHTVISIRVVGQSNLSTYTPDTTALSPVELDRIWDAMPEMDCIVPGGITVGSPDTWYTVEYIGGYNGWVDDALKLAILEVASRTMTYDHDDVLTIKDDMASEPSRTASIVKGWKPEELAMFDRLRRRTVYR